MQRPVLGLQQQAHAASASFDCYVDVRRRGNYGAFLMDDLPLVYELVSELVKVRRAGLLWKSCLRA